jgi:hypothetical protein
MKSQDRGWKAAPTGKYLSSVLFFLFSVLCSMLYALCPMPNDSEA